MVTTTTFTGIGLVSPVGPTQLFCSTTTRSRKISAIKLLVGKLFTLERIISELIFSELIIVELIIYDLFASNFSPYEQWCPFEHGIIKAVTRE